MVIPFPGGQMRSLFLFIALIGTISCKRTADGDTNPATDDTATPYAGPAEFIGSPCEADADCPYDGGVCLTDGFPDGMCSMSCESTCPDAEGHPTTFCVSTLQLPASADPLGVGACVSRCSLSLFPDGGCRDEYGCSTESRQSDPSYETMACMPGAENELSDCYIELAQRGVSFEPTYVPPDHPDEAPHLTCEIEDAVRIQSPMLGVELLYYDGSPTNPLASCEMAHALADTIEDVKPYGVDTLYHIGTYNCRAISGTDQISQHGYANAIDIFGFGFTDGTYYSLEDDWEHDTTSFETDGGEFLYDSSRRWYDAYIWNIILTPNYNVGHDNHFHVDLTPSSHYIGFTDWRYFGPAPYAD
jgi:hypothetical protein